MAEGHDALMEGAKVVNDTLRDLFFDTSTTLRLLKQSTTLNDYEQIAEVTESWFFEYSEYRQAFKLEIAQSDDTLDADITSATHIGIDDDIYVIRTGDTLPPKGLDVTWKLFCERFVDRGQFKSLY